ncbi:MAG: C39 family peptidase [Atopobiaceae bacterium]|nr:C39 family peptidase [Atopobiaceae bacterium]MCH4181302.1 C39 family peptidase [Atopobiaceae bacterium]MCH4213772.1 C39 family peptidase [Atopobiaceae bacterium]MCH4230690.1 C39 family peptidase [Atopobiaceae bacterium]MCH4277287.1 C39 family peptidase [Atopobiaceae bacterium]
MAHVSKRPALVATCTVVIIAGGALALWSANQTSTSQSQAEEPTSTMATTCDAAGQGSHVEISCPLVDQNEEGAAMGCEAAAAYMALRAKGHLEGWSFLDFIDTMPYADDGNPYHGYVGDPWKDSEAFDGMMASAVADWTNAYTDGSCTDITGCTEEDLIGALEAGDPCIVWVSGGFSPTWRVDDWFGPSLMGEHAVTLVGYDPDGPSFLVADPGTGTAYWVGWDTFAASWECVRNAVRVS